MRGQLFPCVGGQLDEWVVVGIDGVVDTQGGIVLWFSWDNSRLVVLPLLKNNDEQ